MIGVTIATGLVVALWLLYLATMSKPVVRKGLIYLSLLLLDTWLWALAFAPFWDLRWVAIPLTIVNLVLAYGLISGGTGYRLRGGPDDRMAMSDPRFGRAAAGFDEHQY
jgi:hypothetical protein